MSFYDDPTKTTYYRTDQYATNELPVDMHSKQMTAYPQLTPMTSILTRLSEDTAHNFRVDWQEPNEIPTTVVCARTESSASTTVYFVANATTLVKDTLLFNPRTFDLRIVDSTPSSDTSATVTISQGGSTSAVWLAGDIIHVILPALGENDNSANSETYRDVSVADDNVYNYIHLAKLQFSMTRTADLMTTHFGGPGSKRMQLKQQKYREFRIKLEKSIYFSGRANDTTDYRYMMGGIVYYLRNGSLYKDFGGTMTETGFRNMLGDYKDENPDSEQVFAFVAGHVHDIIDNWGLNKVRLSPMSKKYGLDIYIYVSRGLTVNLVPLPLLTDPVTRGWGFILDMERIRLKYLRRAMYYPEAKNVGESEIIYDTYLAQLSMILANESRHMMFVGALL